MKGQDKTPEKQLNEVERGCLLKKEVQQNLGTQGPQVHWNLSIHVSILTFMVLVLHNQLPKFNRRGL